MLARRFALPASAAPGVKLLANENFPHISGRLLKQRWDLVMVSERRPGITDREVMRWASEERRIVLTFDRDYGRLVFQDGYRPPGLIYLRLTAFLPDEPGRLLQALFDSGHYAFAGHFSVVRDGHVRQRRLT